MLARQRTRQIAGAPRLRRAGPGAARHGGLRDRAERGRSTPAADGCSSSSRRTASRMLVVRIEDHGPGHPASGAGARRTVPVADRARRRPHGRPPAHRPVRHSGHGRAGHLGDARQAAARRRARRGRRLGGRARPGARRRRPADPVQSWSTRTRSCSARWPSWPSGRRSWTDSTPSWRRPTAACSRSMPSWTTGPAELARASSSSRPFSPG